MAFLGPHTFFTAGLFWIRLCDYHLTQLKDNPTYVSEYFATLIDHTLYTPDIPVHSISQATGLSDHCINFVDFLVSVQRPVSTY